MPRPKRISEKAEHIIEILVCQSQDVLQHKLTDGKEEAGRYCFWEMSRFPRRIRQAIEAQSESTGRYSVVARIFSGIYDDDDLVFEYFHVRLYFAVNGIVQGYFVCRACDQKLTELRFHSEDWFPMEKPVKIKPSQGWRYFD